MDVNWDAGLVNNTRIVAAIAAAGFIGVAGYQILLALSVLPGTAAWGGVYDVLPVRLRIASGVSALVLLLAAMVVLGRAGYWGAGIRFSVFHWGTWILVGLMALSGAANLASTSTWERYLLGPVALLLSLLCLLTARSEVPKRKPTG